MGILDTLLSDLLLKHIGGIRTGKEALRSTAREDDILAPWVAALSGGISAMLYSSPAGAAQSETLQRVAYDTQQDKLNTGSERNAVARTNTMAQSQQQALEPVNFMPKDEDEALAILQGELQSQAVTFQEEASQRMIVAENAIEVLQQPNRVITNKTLGRDEQGRKLPYAVRTPSNKIQDVELDPSTGEWIPVQKNGLPIRNPKQGGSIEITTSDDLSGLRSDPYKIAAASIETSQRQKPVFNLTEALEKTKTLGGEDLHFHISKTLSDIDVQIANEMKRIRQAAALESGFTSAQAAYQRNIMLDDAAGFIQRFGHASGQTILSQQEMARARQVAMTFEQSLSNEDSRIAELRAAKQSLSRIEQIELRKQARREGREEKEEAKREAIAEVTTPQELTNFRFLHGTKGDDVKDSLTLHQLKKTDKVTAKLLTASSENIHAFLMDEDIKVREGALKLFLNYEKAVNPSIPRDAKTTPTYEMVKKAIANPFDLIKFIPDEEQRKRAELTLKAPKSAADLKEIRQQVLPFALLAYVENQVQGKFLSNMLTWKGTDFTGEDALSKTVKRIKATSPKGEVPLNAVIDSYIQEPQLLPDGTPVSVGNKVNTLVNAINIGINGIDKNMFMNADTVESIRMRLANRIKNESAKAHIRGITGTIAPFGPTFDTQPGIGTNK